MHKAITHLVLLLILSAQTSLTSHCGYCFPEYVEFIEVYPMECPCRRMPCERPPECRCQRPPECDCEPTPCERPPADCCEPVPYEGPVVCCFEPLPCYGPYIGLFGGIDETCLDFDRFTQVYHPFFMGGVCLGYKFPRLFRIEGEFAYRQSELYFRCQIERHNIYSGMFNLYFEAPIGRLTPFVGLGLGSASTNIHVDHRHFPRFHRSCTNFACQFLFGINFRVCPKTDLGIKEIVFYQDPYSKYNISLAFTLNQYF